MKQSKEMVKDTSPNLLFLARVIWVKVERKRIIIIIIKRYIIFILF